MIVMMFLYLLFHVFIDVSFRLSLEFLTITILLVFKNLRIHCMLNQ